MAASIVSGIALVTGGARGLGNAVAAAFARNGCKAIAIVDILSDEEMNRGKQKVEKYGAECLVLRGDVTDEKEVETVIAKTAQAFGRIDYAANFAGITGSVKALEDTLCEDFERTLRVNTTGVFLSTKHQIRQMSKQDVVTRPDEVFAQRGSIINCASVNSLVSGAYTGSYTASKHAVAGITKAAALEARSKQIRVNSLSPGFLWTDMVANGTSPQFQEAWAQYEARQGRKAIAQEIGDATVMLASSKMGLVNAHNLVCDFGFIQNENPF